ncbi:MAG: ABC transporter permease subunit, partial [Acidiferrobacteraceae bacterium]|nr:ABC transporter permease subunit [Acidiferrobacteraceae bacterium]
MDSVWEYRNLLLSGTAVTVQLALASLTLSVLLGLIGASAKLAVNPIPRRIAGIYTTLVRGVPDLVLMMLLFYGGQQVVNDLGAATGWWDYVEINQFIAGVWSIGF